MRDWKQHIFFVHMKGPPFSLLTIASWRHGRPNISGYSRLVINLYQDLLTIENTDSYLNVHAPHYAYELLVRVRFSFQKLLQTRHKKNRNNKKLSKQGLVMIKHCLGNSQLTRYQSKEFYYITFLYRTSAKAYACN